MQTDAAIVFIESGRGEFGMYPMRKAKSLGLRTVLVARDLDIYRDSLNDPTEIERFVDATLEVDTTRPDVVVEAVADYAASTAVVGVFAAIDYFVPTASRVAHQLGLPGLSPSAAGQARNKLATMQACERVGVPAPKFRYIETSEELAAAAQELGWPLVLKPVTEAASIGVKLCRTMEEGETHLADLLALATDMRGQERPRGALVEEFLVGYEVSVESFDHAGVRVNFGTTDKGTRGTPYFIEDGEAFPSALPPDVTSECERVANAALDAIGFNFGASHVELKVTAGGPKIVEINGRLGSDPIGKMIELSTGVDVAFEAIRAAVGLVPDLRATRSRAACARSLIPAYPGVLQSVDGVDLLRALPGFVEYVQYMAPGTHTGPLLDDRPIIGHLVYEADSPAEAMMLARAGESLLTVGMGAGDLPT